MLVKVLSAGFYAQQDTKTPVNVGIISIVITMALNALLIFPLAHAGLALASTLGSWLNTALLFILLYRRNVYRAGTQAIKFIIQILSANIMLGGILWYFMGNADSWLKHHAIWRFEHLAWLFFIGGMGYFSVLWLLGMRWKEYRIHHE
jgi:putative peptidoglycan lipid II flippase